VRRSGIEPLRPNRPDAVAPDPAVRQVPVVLPELAGGRDLSGGGRVRRAGVLVLLPVSEPVPGGEGAADRAPAAARVAGRRTGFYREILIWLTSFSWARFSRC